MNRRQFLCGLGGLAVLTPTYSFGVEPAWFEVTTKKVRLAQLAPNTTLRVLHLSDFHASETVPWSMIQHALKLGMETRPDLICLTGDFVTGKVDDLSHYSAILSALPKVVPTFACLGNHDGGRWVKKYDGYTDDLPIRQMLSAAGITCLKNQSQKVLLQNQPVNLLGFGDLYAGDFKPQLTFSTVPEEDKNLPTVLLVHNPDCTRALAAKKWDLMLCGHTHGGQVKVPFYGAPVLPIHDRRFAEGLIAWQGRQVHVTRGVGNLGGFRFNCPPEISVLELSA